MQKVEFKIIKLSDIWLNEYNPNTMPDNYYDALKRNIEQDGYLQPLLLNRVNGKFIIIDGEHRYKALKQLDYKEAICWIVEIPEIEAKKLTLKMGLRGQYDQVQLSSMLDSMLENKEIDIPTIEIDIPHIQLNELDIDSNRQDDKSDIENNIPEVEEKEVITKTDDIWLLGRHRVMCGDSTKESDVGRLMDGKKADREIYFDNVFYENKIKLNNNRKVNKNAKKIVSFSGGKDSTAMLLMLIEEKVHIDEVLNVNMGEWEWDEINLHITDIKKLLHNNNIKFTELKPENNLFAEIEKKGFPNMFVRWCSGIKINLMKNYLKKKFPSGNYIEYVGISFEEKERAIKDGVIKKCIVFPLIERKITGNDALEYCKMRGFNFYGIYDRKILRTGCWCCPLQDKKSLYYLRSKHPKKWNYLIELQRKTKTSFRLNYNSLLMVDHNFWLEDFGYKNKIRYLNIEKKSNLHSIINFLEKKSNINNLVYDKMLDYGDTLIACEKTNRTCYGMEIDSYYCDVILNRYINYIDNCTDSIFLVRNSKTIPYKEVT